MKIMNIFRVIMVSLLAISAQQAHCARSSLAAGVVAKQAAVAISTSPTVTQDIALATTFAESELIVKKATEVMEAARESLLSTSSTPAENAQNVKTIIDQNYAIVMAKQKLEKMRDELANKIEKEVAPESYWGRFVAGTKNVGSGIAALFAAGTGTEEEKETARQVIKGLTEQEVKVTEKYALLQKGLASAEQAELKKRYEIIVALFEAAIYKQQLVTGDARSSMIKRSLLLGAAAAGTIAAGVMLKSKYFGAEAETTEGGETEMGITISGPTSTPLTTPGVTGPSIIPTPETVQPKLTDTSETLIPETPSSKILSIEEMEAVMREQAKTESTPYKVGRWFKEAPGRAYEAAKEAFQNRGETPEYPEEQGIEELGTALTTTIPSKIEEGKQAVSEAFEKRTGRTIPQAIGEGKEFVRGKAQQVSDYFTGPGQPAQNPEEVEGITIEDLEPLMQSKVGQFVTKKIAKGKAIVGREFEKGFAKGYAKGSDLEDWAVQAGLVTPRPGIKDATAVADGAPLKSFEDYFARLSDDELAADIVYYQNNLDKAKDNAEDNYVEYYTTVIAKANDEMAKRASKQ